MRLPSRVIPLSTLSLTILFTALACSPGQADPLKGSVKETDIAPSKVKMPKPVLEMPTPVLPDMPKKKLKSQTGKFGEADQDRLKGNVKDSALTGNVDDYGSSRLKAGSARLGKDGVLKGNATLDASGLSGQDPDYGDEELAVEWDKWRNRLLWAVQSGMQSALNNPDDPQLRWDPERQTMVSRFPLGTQAWFFCKVTKDRHIEKLKIIHSSGYPGYDKAVLDSVRALEGTSILRFPGRSRRLAVSQAAGIKTATSGGRRYYNFGDVERYRYRP